MKERKTASASQMCHITFSSQVHQAPRTYLRAIGLLKAKIVAGFVLLRIADVLLVLVVNHLQQPKRRRACQPMRKRPRKIN